MTSLPDYQEALGRALVGVETLGETQAVELTDAYGRVLAEPVIADRDLPPFNRSQLDGYAVRSDEVGRVDTFAVAGSIAAGDPADMVVPPAHCVAIATGAPVPAELDAVIGHEFSDRANPVRFQIDALKKGHAVHHRGVDAAQGDTLIATPTVLGVQHLGIAAAAGLTSVAVMRRPRVTVLTSGDEVVPLGAAVAEHQIRNSNAPMVRWLLEMMGAEPIAHEHLRDSLEATSEAVKRALGRSDLVVTVGGISAGDRDHFPQAFDAARIEVSLRGAAIQPGRPIMVGRAPDRTVFVALPGNPVSVLACACLFCWPVIRLQLGLHAALPWRTVKLREPVQPNPRRRAFRPAVIESDDRARVPDWAGSGDLAHTAPTDGLLELPVQDAPVQADETLRFLPWP